MKPPPSRPSLLLPALLALGLLGLAGHSRPAGATLFVLSPDEVLADRASAVVEARIESRDQAPVAGLPSTDYMITVERVVSGEVPGSTLILRVPGGVGPEGMVRVIHGAPGFAEGERALLFLYPREDGTFGTVHLMMGAFHEVTVGGKRIAVRDFGEARQLPAANGDGSTARRTPRDMERFTAWLADRGRGVERPADYFTELPRSALSAIAERFTLLRFQGSLLRWAAFERGETVTWLRGSGGQPGLGSGATDRAIRAGIAAWNDVPNAEIRMRLGGTTNNAINALDGFDGLNTFIFDNPTGHDAFGGDFACPGGGVLAVGGPSAVTSLVPDKRNGEDVLEVIEADIVTNANAGCFFEGRATAEADAAALFGHELGHALGIGHSSENPGEPDEILFQALMFFRLHADGRGAELNSDDRRAARALYGTGAGGPVPAAPTALEARALAATRVELTWNDVSDDETGFRIDFRKASEGGFSRVPGGAPANSERFVVEGLEPATPYVFRIRARNANGTSPTSNEAEATTLSAAPAPLLDFSAEPVSTTQIRLAWDPVPLPGAQVVIERRSPSTIGFVPVDVVPAGDGEVLVSGLAPDTPYTFRARVRADGVDSDPAEASATTRGAGGPCAESAETVCLLGGRFAVEVAWANQFEPGENGVGRFLPADNDTTGFVWFFKPDNVELLVKMIDARDGFGAFWFFYGALSTVEYWITVRDTELDRSNTYHNPPGELCGDADTQAFPEAGGAPVAAPLRAARIEAPLVSTPDAAGSCVAGPNALCLLDGRFRVEVAWDNPRQAGDSGVGHVVPAIGTDETGFFWFFDPENVELATKMIDATSTSFESFWFFWGALTDVGYTITVTDTVTSQVQTYGNEPFDLCGGSDLEAFPGT